MILNAFALLDMKTGHFHTPFFMHHPGQAIRACMDLGADMSTTVGRHPADFALVHIGTFDDQSGVLRAEAPSNLGTVLSMLPQQPATPLFSAPAGDSLTIPPAPNGHATS